MAHLREKKCVSNFLYANEHSDTMASSPETLPLYGLLLPFVLVVLKFPLLEELIGLARPSSVDVPL